MNGWLCALSAGCSQPRNITATDDELTAACSSSWQVLDHSGEDCRGERRKKGRDSWCVMQESRGEKMVAGKDLERRREGGLRGEGDEACSSGFLSLM